MLSNGVTLFHVGFGKTGLWPDTEPSTGPSRKALGLKIEIRWGPLWFALPRTWRAFKTLAWDHIEPGDEKSWRCITVPFFVLPFVTLVVGTLGVYLGGKYSGETDYALIPSARFCINRWSK